MIKLESVDSLFDDRSPVPEGTLKQQIVDEFKLNYLPGVPEQNLEISFNPEEGGDILIKAIDPHAASGYLVFQDEGTYRDWLDRQLYEPSQDEIQEAVSRGSGSS